jgi:glutathione peroxidase
MSSAGSENSAYDFVVKNKKGEPVPLSSIAAGKVSLFVNVASQCGFTPQYKGLQELQEK